MFSEFLMFLLPVLMLGAAVGLFLRGKIGLSLILGLAVALSTAGFQYLIHSHEAPGFTEPLSTTYLLVKYTTDTSLLVQYVVIFMVCWSRSQQPNNSFKRTPDGTA